MSIQCFALHLNTVVFVYLFFAFISNIAKRIYVFSILIIRCLFSSKEEFTIKYFHCTEFAQKKNVQPKGEYLYSPWNEFKRK